MFFMMQPSRRAELLRTYADTSIPRLRQSVPPLQPNVPSTLPLHNTYSVSDLVLSFP